MTIRSLAYGLFLVSLVGCNRGQPDNSQSPARPATATPPAAPQIRVTGIHRMTFASGESALVLNYETDIPIEEKEALTAEVQEIWKRFQEDVEQAHVNTGVIRATHYESTGMIRKGKGYGFIFVKSADGTWKLQDDEKK